MNIFRCPFFKARHSFNTAIFQKTFHESDNSTKKKKLRENSGKVHEITDIFLKQIYSKTYGTLENE